MPRALKSSLENEPIENRVQDADQQKNFLECARRDSWEQCAFFRKGSVLEGRIQRYE